MKIFFLLLCVVSINCRPGEGNTNLVSGTYNDTEVMDLTNTCIDEERRNIFLPFGIGAPDALVFIISELEDIKPDCVIVINRPHEKDRRIIMVVEYPDVGNASTFQCNQGYIIAVMNLDTNRRVPYCEKVHSQQQGKQVFFFAGNATSYGLRIAARLNFDTLKITITAGRDLGSKQDCRSTEVKCLIDDSRICISNILLCDGNINCGKYDENDEHYKVCQVAQYEHLWIIVLAGVVIIIIIVSVGLFLIKTMIKKMTDNFFIFDEDEDNKLMLQSMMRSHVIEQIMKVDETCICDDTIIKNQTQTLKK